MRTSRTHLGEAGRLVIPVEYRRALGLGPGDEVLLVLEEGELRLLTPERALARAQALVRRYVTRAQALSSELIAERREESSRE
ncbi:MAG: AbrB/MazE/SpoVT family DNA-binding domain-containing protein [Acidobacteriota bacterium]